MLKNELQIVMKKFRGCGINGFRKFEKNICNDFIRFENKINLFNIKNDQKKF